MTLTVADFFEWCQARHLTEIDEIASFFFTTTEYVQQLSERKDIRIGSLAYIDEWLEIAVDIFDKFIGDDRSVDCLDRVPRTKKDFFEWCNQRGLVQISQIADAFKLSDQTVRNWERYVANGEKPELSYWYILTIFCYDTYLGKDVDQSAHTRLPQFAPMSFTLLKKWQNRHNLATYQDTGDIFRIKRQAVHNWFTRSSLPDWLPMASEAINIVRPGKTRKTVKQVA